MLKKLLLISFVFFSITLPGIQATFAQSSGSVSGVVLDKSTDGPLPSARVIIVGTERGVLTNQSGQYNLRNIPSGSYQLSITYIGYRTEIVPVEVQAGQDTKVDIGMTVEGLLLDEVVISAQLLGQTKAINQQLNSDALVNVVSSDKIKELPDVNAAEAIGRLPGISVNRTGGEASQVVVRGLSPELTSVTINGVRVPSTSATDRSVNLSMISPELLSSIEVYKSPTADMDGDAIGGIVNLGVFRAMDETQIIARAYGGYNGLSDQFSNYKASINGSSRFFNKKFGVIAKANIEKINRSSESASSSWDSNFGDDQWPLTGTTIQDNINFLQRIGGNLQLDYQYKSGYVVAQAFFSQRNSDLQQLANVYSNAATVTHNPRHSESATSTLQTLLSGKQKVSLFEIDWVLARSQTVDDNPYDVGMVFQQFDGINLTGFFYTPDEMLAQRNFNYDKAWLQRYTFEPSKTSQTNYTGSVDIKMDFNLGKKIGGFLKVGGKYRYDDRIREQDFMQQPWYYLDANVRAKAVSNWPGTLVQGGSTGDHIMLSNFFEGDDRLPIWGNTYFIAPLINMQTVDDWHTYQQGELLLQYDQEHQRYDLTETVKAGYAMAKIKYGNWLSIIPGVRYEYSDNRYHGYISSLDVNGAAGSIRDTTSYQQYGELLPSVHIKIKPLKWFDVRMSAVKTLARPNYNMILPRARLDVTNGRLFRGNPQLKYAEAWNYDASVSLFSGKWGLLTLGGFYKHFDNYFTQTDRVMSAEEALSLGYPGAVYDVPEDYINFDNSIVYGLEADLQTSLKMLPKPLNGVVLSVNATRLWSRTYVPLFKKVTKYDPVLRRNVVDFENSYIEFNETTLPDQVGWITNVSLGYDYKGFSARVSLIYQSSYLKSFSTAAELSGEKYTRRYVAKFLRYDASVSQKLGKHLMLMASFANFANAKELEYQYLPQYVRSDNRYGMTIDLGIQYKY
ncbi:MAG: TonB-dependent receptor [Bacteroidia bacterium]